MSEQNEDFYVETYVKKQEGLLLEHIRRQIQAETKNSVIEIALVERTNKVAELEEQIKQLNTAVNQAVMGLQSLTIERDGLKKNLDEANERIEYLAKFQQKYKDLENELANRSVVVDKLSNRIETYQQDMEQMKTNYTAVSSALEDATTKLSKLSKIKNDRGSKKAAAPVTETEWTDGNQV